MYINKNKLQIQIYLLYLFSKNNEKCNKLKSIALVFIILMLFFLE